MKKKNILLSTLALLGGIAITTPLIVSCSPTYQKGENMEVTKLILKRIKEVPGGYLATYIKEGEKLITEFEVHLYDGYFKNGKLTRDVEINYTLIPKGTLVEFQ